MPDLVHASRERQTVHDLLDRHRSLIQALLKPRELIKGTLYRLRTRCGKAGCHCARSEEERHVSTVMTWSEDGKTRLRTVAPADSLRVQSLTQRYRDFRRARASLVRIHTQILAAVDRLEKALRLPPPPARRPRRDRGKK